MDPSHVSMVRQWLDLDNKLLTLKEQVQELNDQKKEIEDDIIEYIEKNNLDKVVVNLSDGCLKFPKTSTKQTLSLKYVKNTLTKYNDDKEVNMQVNVEEVCKFLTSNLETKTKISIKRDVK
jgi:hypothetical protein